MAVNIVVLGSTGTLGRSVVEKLAEVSGFNVIPVTRQKISREQRKFYWDFCSPVPMDIASADVVINCARSISFLENIRITKLLCECLSSRTLFLNLSSNCVSARPRSFFSRALYKGDAYVREKRIIEKFTLMRPNSVVVRPSIVPDEGGWLNFLTICSSTETICSPFDMERSRVDISSRSFVGDEIVRVVTEGKFPHLLELVENTISVKEFIVPRNIRITNSNTYFNSTFKNIFTLILCSRFLPDYLVFAIQSLIQTKVVEVHCCVPREEFSIEGMTRLYLFGSHTSNSNN